MYLENKKISACPYHWVERHPGDSFFIKEARFFHKKDRCESRPSVETYKNKEFVSEFLFEGTIKKCILRIF